MTRFRDGQRRPSTIDEPMESPAVRKPADGQVHKVVRLVATSPSSWEDAARNGVEEAAKTIVDLRSATVADFDTVIDEGRVQQYRVKLEMVFQFDRSRR
ncbi:MAG: dodecin family protein, partial [Acidimicrobiia bacterium]|nr:dodecin family protein [Acidimicrobiia bacterium]